MPNKTTKAKSTIKKKKVASKTGGIVTTGRMEFIDSPEKEKVIELKDGVLGKVAEGIKTEISKAVEIKLIKTCSKDGYTINLYQKGKSYFVNTNLDSELISISEWTANEIIEKGDRYNNLHGLYSK